MLMTSSDQPDRPVLPPAHFVGREAELRELLAALERASAGRGQVLLLVGEPGIGKTRLAEELSGSARECGALVLWGQCYEWEGAPPYWPWVQALRACLRALDVDTLRAALGRGVADIAQVVPEVGEVVPDLPDLPPLEPAQARFRLFDSLATFLGNLARSRPLVIVLEDLHWADKPSLLLLQFLARAARDARLLVLGTYRNVEVGRQHPLAEALAELARQPESRRVMLRGLPRDDVARYVALVAGREPPGALVDAVYHETEGNPFFVSEVVRLLAADGALARPDAAAWDPRVPESVREVVGRRLERLSADCNRILSVAAVIGREFSLPLLERASELDAGRLLDLLDEAVQAQIVHEQDSLAHYRFSHVLIQETLYDELSTATRVRLHARTGEALEQLHAANTDVVVADLARHFFQAAPLGKADQAIAYAVQAAEQANTQIAWEEAARHFERALQALDLIDRSDSRQRCTLLLALAEAQYRSGDAARAESTFRRAAMLARQMGAFEQLAEAITAYVGFTIGFTYGELRPLIEEILDGLDTGDSVLRVKVLAKLATALYFLPETLERREALVEEAVTMARRLDDPAALAYALLSRHEALWRPDNVAERLADTTEVVRIANDTAVPEVSFAGHLWRFYALMELGDIAEADHDLEALARLVEEWRAPAGRWTVKMLRAMRALLAGRFAESEHLIEQARPIGQLTHPRQWGGSVDRAYWRFVAAIRREIGKPEEIEELVEPLIAQIPTGTLWYDANRNLRSLLAALYCDIGRETDARAEFERLAAQEFADFARDPLWLNSIAFLTEACVHLQDLPRANTLYALLEPYARLNLFNRQGIICYGSAAYYLGLLATAVSRWDDAERHFADALALNERMGARPYVAHTQHAWAAMLARRGRPDDAARARDLARQALGTAEELGMTRLVERVQTLIATLTAPPAVDAKNKESIYGLSPRELDVLRLLVEGRSDREIAAALFISHRTVMTHVASILNKLGVPSRTAAASQAVREGIV
jgi:DNA-binding CsgD family transcriptional regulator/tetratricopeptide (TPR) repeat protein